MAKRGSRVIDVDGALYRWKVRRRANFEADGPASYVTVIVEPVVLVGRPLQIVLPRLETDGWLHGPGHVVLPREVADWIRKARAAGWLSTMPDALHHLHLTGADL